MAGIVNENIIFPVLDLVRREMRRNNSGSIVNSNQGDDLFEGVPQVSLIRDNPRDLTRMTGAHMMYSSGYTEDIYLKFDSDWGLEQVVVVYLYPDGKSIATYHIRLNYDNEGRLAGTVVNSM